MYAVVVRFAFVCGIGIVGRTENSFRIKHAGRQKLTQTPFQHVLVPWGLTCCDRDLDLLRRHNYEVHTIVNRMQHQH